MTALTAFECAKEYFGTDAIVWHKGKCSYVSDRSMVVEVPRVTKIDCNSQCPSPHDTLAKLGWPKGRVAWRTTHRTPNVPPGEHIPIEIGDHRFDQCYLDLVSRLDCDPQMCLHRSKIGAVLLVRGYGFRAMIMPMRTSLP